MEDEDEFGPVNLNDEEMDHFEIYPMWKHTKEGKEVLTQLTKCQERLATAKDLLTELEKLTGLMSGPSGMSWDINDLTKLHDWIIDFLEDKP